MRIGIDIDNTITDTSKCIKDMIEENNVKGLSYDFDNYTEEELKTYDKLIRENIEDVMKKCKLNENAKEVINELYQNNEIYLITARTNFYSDNLKDITINYLKENNIMYHELLFGYEDKRDICLEKKLDIMLDDNIKVIESIKDTNIRGVLYQTKYNQEYVGEKVNNWLEFKNLIG